MADRLRPALGLIVGLAALTLAGCGASSSPPSQHGGSASASSALTAKARFVAQAQAVCRALSRQEQPLRARQESLKRVPSATSAQDFVALVRQVGVLSRAADRKLRALSRPPGDARNIETLLSGFSAELADVSQLATAAAKQESVPGETAVLALRRTVAHDGALANEYGMKVCFNSE
jgi:hypothetical protein